MNICVYLGAHYGKSSIYHDAITELGEWIATNGHRLIYGGSKTGLMGSLAQSVLDYGGEVIGVEPQFFIDREYQLEGITELIATKDMTERKAKLIELADFCIAFPGGVGTAEEISEVICADSLGLLNKPYCYYNVGGFYDTLISHYRRMLDEGFIEDWLFERIHVFNSLSEIAAFVATIEK